MAENDRLIAVGVCLEANLDSVGVIAIALLLVKQIDDIVGEDKMFYVLTSGSDGINDYYELMMSTCHIQIIIII